MDEDNGGSHPWSLDGDSISHLLLFNYSDKPHVFGVGISNGAIVWDKKYTLAPYETREMSINELIDDEVQDDKGQALSPYRTSGVLNWMVPESGQGTGRLMVTSHSRALARNFSCGQFIVVCGGYVWTNFDMIPINSVMAAIYTAEPQFCDEFSPSQCVGGSSVGGGSATYNWNIGASTVIRPNTTSDQYAQSPNVYGVGPGSGSGYVEMYAGSCQVGGGSNPTTVQQPKSLKLVKAPPAILQQGNNSATNGCPLGYYGIMLDVDYQVLDQNGAPMANATMEPQELLTGDTGYHDIGPSRISGTSKLTRADGTFDDAPVGVCKDIPFTTPSTEKQQIQILLNGTGYPVRTNNYSFSSTNLPNQGTISNGAGGDINASQ